MFCRGILFLISCVNAYVDITPQVSEFSGVEVTGPFVVRINVDENPNVRIMADLDDTNVTDSISTIVENESLKIRFVPPYDEDPDRFLGLIRIYITTRSLPNLALDGSGVLIVDSEIKDPSINVFSNGAGNISLQVYTPSVNIVMFGAGIINIRGTANAVHISSSGTGRISAENLLTDSVTIAGYGEGECWVNARDSLSVIQMGTGAVQYVGDPTRINVMSRGSGTVMKFVDENLAAPTDATYRNGRTQATDPTTQTAETSTAS